MTTTHKKTASILAFGVAALLCAQTSSFAAYSFDLRATAVNGTPISDPLEQKNLHNVPAGAAVTFSIFAIVTGAAGNAAFEGIGQTGFSLLTDVASAVKGNWSVGQPNVALFPSLASNGGTLRDTNADGFFDRLGQGATSSTQSAATGFDYNLAVSGTPAYSGSGVTPVTDGQQFFLGTAVFTLGATGGNLGVTLSPAIYTSGFGSAHFAHKWSEDAATQTTATNKAGGFNNLGVDANNTGAVLAGAPVSLQVIPEPSVAVTLLGGVATLLGLRRRKH